MRARVAAEGLRKPLQPHRASAFAGGSEEPGQSGEGSPRCRCTGNGPGSPRPCGVLLRGGFGQGSTGLVVRAVSTNCLTRRGADGPLGGVKMPQLSWFRVSSVERM